MAVPPSFNLAQRNLLKSFDFKYWLTTITYDDGLSGAIFILRMRRSSHAKIFAATSRPLARQLNAGSFLGPWPDLAGCQLL